MSNYVLDPESLALEGRSIPLQRQNAEASWNCVLTTINLLPGAIDPIRGLLVLSYSPGLAYYSKGKCLS